MYSDSFSRPIPKPRPTAASVPLLALILALVGCTVGPDYEVPEPTTPDAWHTAVAAELEMPDSPLETWWLRLDDPKLDQLIARARESSLDLQAAAFRVQEARALLGIATGRYAPDVDINATYNRSEPSDNGLFPPAAGGPETTDLYNVGFGLNWEIDLFGRLRRNAEAARAGLGGSVEDYRDVLVVLLADVANNYIEVRSLQSRIRYAEANIAAQRDSFGLTRARFDAGLTSARDVAQAEANLANTEATIPALEASLEATLNILAILLGETPGSLHNELSGLTPIPEPEDGLTLGLPAELLRRRPDIRQAERQLAAQTARIGVAKADLYPTFSLAGVLALQSTSGSDLFDSSSTTWSLVPGLRWNIFSAGKIRNQIRAEEARTQQALLFYERTVLVALGEVESALVAYERQQVRRDHLLRAATSWERAVELADTQYRSGLTDFQSFLDAQRELFSQQDAYATSEGRVVQNLIALNRALGGGWDVTEDEDIIATAAAIAATVEPVEGADNPAAGSSE